MNRARRTTATAATAVVLATAGGLSAVTAAPASAAGCVSPVHTRQILIRQESGPLYGGGGWTASEQLGSISWDCRGDICAGVTEYRVSR